MKTYKEWFGQLPEPYRSQAIASDDRSYKDYGNGRANTLDDAIYYSFNWSSSKEGGDYWAHVYGRAKRGGFDKPIKQEGEDHYKMPIEPIEFIVKNDLGFREGNVIKYVCRYKAKGGAEDIRKAIHYLEMILEDYS